MHIEAALVQTAKSVFEKQLKALTSIKGIGVTLATALIIATGGFTYFDKSGETGEDEDVAYLFKSLGGELLFDDYSQIFLGEIATVNSFESDFVAAEWITFYISIVTCA